MSETDPIGPTPRRTRTLKNHHMDGTRWDYFVARPGDVVVATSYKAGTTWMQAIVAHLLFDPEDPPAPLASLSPWLEMRAAPLEIVLKRLEAQRHRRFVKTHLPLDALRFDPRLRYVYVARDARDVFVSLWNHYANHTDDMFDRVNRVPDREGDEFPRPPADVHAFWRDWITRGWLDWETDGWPYWSHLHHVQSWWDFRHVPNVLLVHFADLLEDTAREVRRVAAFLGVDAAADRVARVASRVSFTEMKKRGARYAPGEGAHWKGGTDTFLHRGTNGRWRDVLSADELALYDAACGRTLTPDCRAWLEHGGPT